MLQNIPRFLMAVNEEIQDCLSCKASACVRCFLVVTRHTGYLVPEFSKKSN